MYIFELFLACWSPQHRTIDFSLLASSNREPEGFLQRRIRENPTHFRSNGQFTLKNSQIHILRCTAKKLGFDSFLGLHLKM